MIANKTKWVRLGDYIEEVDKRNAEGQYAVESVRGISVDKVFIDTKANMEGVSVHSYKVVSSRIFAYVADTSRRGDKVALAFNSANESYLISSVYTTFTTKVELLPEYLYMLLNRGEFDRYARFNSWGSARETFSWEELCRVRIPLPSLSVQHDLVATYEGLQRLAEENEALIAPLTEACQAFIVDCQKKYPMVDLGKYIEEKDERNSDLSVTLSQGIANTKVFQEPKQVSVNSKSDKIVRKGHFAYNRATTRNGEKISIAYRMGEDCTVSSAYCVFQIIEEKVLNPNYLWLWFSRPEFDRYARYMSKGSAHEFFDWEELCRVQIPLPPPEVQQSIVNLYHCIEEAQKIASEARTQLQTLCPALIQYAEHN